jgi:hypothetical protein
MSYVHISVCCLIHIRKKNCYLEFYSCIVNVMFQEPIDVAVDRGYGHVLVADNGLSCVFIFDSDGKILFQVCALLYMVMFRMTCT